MTPQSDSTLAGMKGFTGLTSDSRKVKPGYLFAALAGTKTDGGKFVKDAVARGAVAVLGAPAIADDVAALGVRFIPDENPRAGLARYAAAFFAAQPDIVAAVTGTKGKSSIVAFLREIWTALGKPAASLGTVGVIGPKGAMPLAHTTPDPVEIHALLAELKRDGVDHLAIEASSHGLDQPHGTKETGGFALAGYTAAPMAGRIVQRIAPLLGVPNIPEPTKLASG
ncbi:MAG TPA: Mur ligase family protein, partial [Rhizomicrobium sp.]|nr:Mur ligase family protein [Rhizomicrobium sp.]